MKTLPRFITPKLLDALKVNPVALLNGARQTGKSTAVISIMDSIKKERPVNYMTFDSATTMASAAAAPETFLSVYKGTLILDEVQLVPDIFRALKLTVDEIRKKDKEHANGKYLLTGSANILALPELSAALVGRMSVLTLHPFSAAEASQGKGNAIERLIALDFENLDDRNISLLDAIRLATFPEIADNTDAERKLWYDGYITTILQRDVRQIAELEKISLLPVLLRTLAARAGGLINDSDIGRQVGLNSVTSRSYRHILKMMFLAFDIEPWYQNIGKRLVKAPKGFLSDTGMLCHMLGLKLDDIFSEMPELFGHVLENLVATELQKLLSFGSTQGTLFHFRTSDGKEIDFVIEFPNGKLFAIEIKKSDSVKDQDFAAIKLLAKETGEKFIGGVVLHNGKQALPFGKNVWAVPLHILWQ
jgi:uncharacterized protein